MKTALSTTVVNFRQGNFHSGTESRDVADIGPHERVDAVAQPDGTVALVSHDRTEYLSIQPDGSFEGRPTDDPGMPGPFEKFTRRGQILTELEKGPEWPPIPPDRNPVMFVLSEPWQEDDGGGGGGGGDTGGRDGVVQTEGKTLRDAGGHFLAIGHTMFWLAWGMGYDRERTLKNLDYMREQGSQFVRVFNLVGQGGSNVEEDSWYDRQCNPLVQGWDAWEQMNRDALEALKARKMRAVATIFAGIEGLGRGDRDRIVATLADLFAAYREQILYVEISNEDKVEQNEAEEHLDTLKSVVPDLLCTDTWGRWGGLSNISAQHPERKTEGEGGMWEHCEQMYEAFVLSGAPFAGSVQEPIGPQSSVAEDDDPARLVCDAVTGFVCGAPVYCYHAGAGIRGGGEADRNRGRCANFWEHATLEATWAGLRAAVANFTGEVPGYGHVSHSNPKNDPEKGGYFPFDTGPLEPLCPDGFLKFYTCSEGLQSGRFAASILNITKDIPCRAPTRRMVFDVYELATGAKTHVELAAGETFTVPGQVNGAPHGGVYLSGVFS